ncbi:hypothetical protein [Flagellimonas zhangzhouensis]|uniref:Uncharacterized protein n=1 Tax=Flagellimonas zhangzhouensis TaxID=1073328 RepID=A0A1H2VWA8_9FLAO|nr:hypothetical protein [Allomuricauda zhangzhouensis]SDQ05181.1 hypothetical protein SAMN05216294_0038 [Allomuricauda zhangzhouensis]SDW72648.1 hypothetical protein SAMN04487892_2254 [Allomuricauda zhangzhouensis]
MKKYITLGLFVLMLAVSCKTDSKKEVETEAEPTTASSDLTGNYVSDGYAQKDEGYDWVGVTVYQLENDQLEIKVRSRADKKRPTCTLDVEVYKETDVLYYTQIDGKKVLFQFADNALSITTENEADSSALYFYCSGGATVAGNYSKIDGGLDQDQIDQTQFSKVLSLQDVGFNVSVFAQDGVNQLTVFTFGLPTEFNETFDIKDQVVTHAEVEDLNSDGSPELVVFTQHTENQKGMVHAFSVNNMQSMSMVYFQPTEENEAINKGYAGHDEFALVETKLVQRFPIFENGEKTARRKQISYNLVEGEAMRQFVLSTVSEFEN